MQENLANMAFDILGTKVGSIVTVELWEASKESKEGIVKTATGVLKGVNPFDGINLDGRLIPFVGAVQAIRKISLEDGRTIYANPHVDNYRGVPIYDIMALANAQEAILGRSLKKEEFEKNNSERGRHK